jgi:WD40 repeat protein
LKVKEVMKKIIIKALTLLFLTLWGLLSFSMNPAVPSPAKKSSHERSRRGTNPLIHPGDIFPRTNEPLTLQELSLEASIQTVIMPILTTDIHNFATAYTKIAAALQNTSKDLVEELRSIFWDNLYPEIAALFSKNPLMEFSRSEDKKSDLEDEAPRDTVTIAFHPSNKYCATITENEQFSYKKSQLDFYALENGEDLKTLTTEHSGIELEPHTTINFSPQGKFILLSNSNKFGPLTLLDTTHNFLPHEYEGKLLAAAFDQSETILFSINLDQEDRNNPTCSLRTWNLQKNTLVKHGITLPDRLSRFSPQKNCIICTTRIPNTGLIEDIIIIDIENKRLRMQTIDASPYMINDGACCFALNEKEKLVAISSYNDIYIWNFETGRSMQQFRHRNIVNSITFNTTGTMLASASDDWSARVWNLATKGNIVLHSTASAHTVADVAFHPKKNMLFSLDNAVRLWDLTESKPKEVIVAGKKFMPNRETSIIVSNDGRFFTTTYNPHLWYLPSQEDFTFDQLIWLYAAIWAQKNLKGADLSDYLSELRTYIDILFSNKAEVIKNCLQKLQ